MKYKNKTDERLKERLGKKINSTDRIISANKMKKIKSSSNSASFNIGRIVNKTGEYDKAIDKVEDKMVKKEEPKEEVIDASVPKAYRKGEITYIKYAGKDVPVSKLLVLAQQDSKINNLVKNINKNKAKANFQGSFPEFVLNQYA